jgi:hypothetical protein
MTHNYARATARGAFTLEDGLVDCYRLDDGRHVVCVDIHEWSPPMAREVRRRVGAQSFLVHDMVGEVARVVTDSMFVEGVAAVSAAREGGERESESDAPNGADESVLDDVEALRRKIISEACGRRAELSPDSVASAPSAPRHGARAVRRHTPVREGGEPRENSLPADPFVDGTDATQSGGV